MVSLVGNEFSSKYCCIGLITMTNSYLLITTTNSNRNETPLSFLVLTTPAKEFKVVKNSISRIIWVMVDHQRILFSEVWDGVKHPAYTKIREGQSTK